VIHERSALMHARLSAPRRSPPTRSGIRGTSECPTAHTSVGVGGWRQSSRRIRRGFAGRTFENIGQGFLQVEPHRRLNPTSAVLGENSGRLPWSPKAHGRRRRRHNFQPSALITRPADRLVRSCSVKPAGPVCVNGPPFGIHVLLMLPGPLRCILCAMRRCVLSAFVLLHAVAAPGAPG
jgi:hypothetical protein